MEEIVRDLESYAYLREALHEGDRENLDKLDEDLKQGKLQLEYINSAAWKVFKDLIDGHLRDAIRSVAQPGEKSWLQGYLYAQLELKAYALGIEPHLRGLEQQRAEIILSETEGGTK